MVKDPGECCIIFTDRRCVYLVFGKGVVTSCWPLIRGRKRSLVKLHGMKKMQVMTGTSGTARSRKCLIGFPCKCKIQNHHYSEVLLLQEKEKNEKIQTGIRLFGAFDQKHSFYCCYLVFFDRICVHDGAVTPRRQFSLCCSMGSGLYCAVYTCTTGPMGELHSGLFIS